jgi:DNA-binding Lrp family transcriptional regulator
MEAQSNQGMRMRAWVLVTAEAKADLNDLAENIAELREGANSVVVRADLVAGPYDIVAPVDAASREDLFAIVGKIRQQFGVMETLTLVVGKHVPVPPGDPPRFPLGDNPWG